MADPVELLHGAFLETLLASTVEEEGLIGSLDSCFLADHILKPLHRIVRGHRQPVHAVGRLNPNHQTHFSFKRLTGA